MEKKKIIRFFTYLMTILLGSCFVNCANNEISKMEDTWREFRSLHPYSYQTVALKHYGDTCVFVMSEPDSWVKESDLEQLFDKYDGQLILRYQPYGFDGQLTDAVGCAILDSISFRNLEKEMFTLLYKTDYKPYYTDLDHPINHVYFSKDYDLNYSISPFIIESDINETFIASSQDGAYREKTITDLLESEMSCSNEIYFSKERGLVIWLFNTDSIIQTVSFLQNARRFALDTDLILGSIPKRDNINKLAIVAREREVPIGILPPLRSETILQLALNKKDKIQQTFDSFHRSINDSTIATSISMTHWLKNTELGNLMVITDVLLKSWSENGEVSDYFMDYPLPESCPFDNGVSNELGYIPIYSWKFFFDGKTGCMPLVYEAPREHMETGKEQELSYKARLYFANLNCVDIVRATQYAAICQSFKEIKIFYSGQKINWVKTPSWTMSNKIWGFGGYILQARAIPKVVESVVRRPPVWGLPVRSFPEQSIGPAIRPFHIPGDNLLLLEGNGDYPRVYDKQSFPPSIRESSYHTNLSSVSSYMDKYPELVNEIEKYPRLPPILSKYPKLADIVVIHRELAKILSEKPALADLLAKLPLLADILSEYPELDETLTQYPKIAGTLTGHRELAKVLSKHPNLADALTRVPKLTDVLTKLSVLAEELARIPNLVVFLNNNPYFIEALSNHPRGGLRESLNLSSTTDVQRGLDHKIHNTPTSQESVLSKAQISEILDSSTQRISKMIEMRQQIKLQVHKLGIHINKVQWEINNTLIAYIIIDKNEEGLKQAA